MDAAYDIIANRIVSYLKSNEYDLIAQYLADDCIFTSNYKKISATGKDEIADLFNRAKACDLGGRFRTKLSVCRAETYYDWNEMETSIISKVIYIHEDVFPPYHKTYMFFLLNESNMICEIHLIQSGVITLISSN